MTAPSVPLLVAGSRLGPYEIVDPLGHGGMGEVYRARDLRLERDVALKVLKRRLADDPDARARFEREVKAVAALSHPNILAIYDVDLDGEIPFSVTELLQGETLRARLGAGPLPWRTAVDLAAAAGEGLAAAHERGIIHRDIKPENLFLTRDNRLKILDFGLARSAGPEALADPGEMPTRMETSSGTVLGTVGYMPPEQVRGLALEPAADIFSLGCVLYEMVTGSRAFERDTPVDTMAAVLHEAPPDAGGTNAAVPPALDRVIRHCLEKQPGRRFRSAHDLATALRALAIDSSVTASATPRRPGRRRTTAQHSLAVLPFSAQADAADLSFVGEGIAENIINTVSGLTGVRVVPRTLSFRHAGREAEPRALGVELNAEAVLSGRLVLRGEQLHVQADLVDTADECQIWGSRFVRPAADLEALAQIIAADISEALASRFNVRVARPRTPRRRKAAGSEAYREFLRGRYHWNKWTRTGVLRAIDAFRAAMDLDPTYAPAYAGLADSYGVAAYYSYLPPAEALPLASHAAARALDLDPHLAEAHATVGVAAMFFDWNWAEAERRLTKAISLNERSLTAHAYYSLFLACQGRAIEALETARRAERLDPMSLLAMSSVAWALLHTGDVEGTEAQLHRMLGVEAEFPDALTLLAHLAEARGDVERATAYNRRWFPQMGLPVERADTLRADHQRGGWPAYWRAYLETLDGASGPICGAGPVIAARILAVLGEADQALDRLERACDAHVPMLAFTGVDLQFATLRGHPRFDALLQRIGLA